MNDEMNRKNIYPVNTVRVCIDQYENMDIAGRLYSKMCAEQIAFNSFNDFLLKADRIFDENCFPQAFQQKRTFKNQNISHGYSGRPKTSMSDTYIEEQQGKVGTFDIIVQTRQKTGWQGVLRDALSKETGLFLSEMELLKMLEQALGKEKKDQTWNHLPGT